MKNRRERYLTYTHHPDISDRRTLISRNFMRALRAPHIGYMQMTALTNATKCNIRDCQRDSVVR